MYLKRITLNNFRAYHGKETIEFGPAANRSISIIAGNNGHGKTSLLTSIVWCLYGRLLSQVEEGYAKDIKAKGSYELFTRDLINRKALEEKKPDLYVELIVSDFTLPYTNEVNQSIKLDLTIRRSVRLANGVPFDSLQIWGSGTDVYNLEDDQKRQDFILKNVLPVEMAKFYLFDAERVVQIAENFGTKDVQKQLAQNFEEIFGLKKYVEVRDMLRSTHDRQKKEAAPREKQIKLKEIELEIENKEQNLDKLTNQISALETQRAELVEERSQLFAEVADSRTVSREDYEEAKRQYQAKHDEEASCKENLVKALGQAPLLIMTRRLSEFNSYIEEEQKYEDYSINLDIRKRNAVKIAGKIRRELEALNENLMQNEFGEYVSPSLMNQISEKVHQVIAEEMVQADQTIPKPQTSFRKDLSQNDLDYFKRNLDQVMKGGGASYLSSLVAQYRQVKNEAAQLGKRIKDMENRLETKQTADTRNRIQELEDQIKKTDRDLGSIETQPRELENELIRLRKQRTVLINEIESGKETQKRLNAIQVIIESLDRFIGRFKSEKINLVQRQATEMMRDIFHKKDFLDQFRIKADGHNVRISLLDADQKERDFSELSMGERQIVITSLLHALIRESYFSFPVFIDSPLQKLDEQHKRSILEHFYVGLKTQTVLLPLLGSELDDYEFELIRQHIDSCYLITHNQGASRFLPVGTAQLFDTHRHFQTISNA